MSTYRLATSNDQSKLIDLLTTAFLDYEYFNIYVDNEIKRQRFVRAIQAICVKISLNKNYPILVGEHGQTLTSAAVLIPPTAPKATLLNYLRHGGLALIEHGGLRNTLGFVRLLDESNAACQRSYPDSWVLETIAVNNDFQGQGLGGQLLTDGVTEYIAAHGGGNLTFITNSLGNRHFYLKHGFTEFHAITLHHNTKTFPNWSFVTSIASAK